MTKNNRAAGGHARANVLSAERRTEIARNAAISRWSNQPIEEKMTKKTPKDYVDVQLRLPQKTIAAIDSVVKIGILGSTHQEVCAHMLRQYIFEQMAVKVQDETE